MAVDAPRQLISGLIIFQFFIVIRRLTYILALFAYELPSVVWVQKVCLVGMGAAPEWGRLIPSKDAVVL